LLEGKSYNNTTNGNYTDITNQDNNNSKLVLVYYS